MIKVAICDDNPKALEHYQSAVEKISKTYSIELKITCFNSGEALLFCLSDEPNGVDIIYLDVMMEGMNGIETARKLRKIGCRAQIIYLSATDKYVFDSFEVEPLYYILKDDVAAGSRKFVDIFLRAVERAHQKTSNCIAITVGSTMERILLDRIMYIEVAARLVSIYLTDAPKINCYTTLAAMQKVLPEKMFIKIHRSYLVNCDHIQKIKRGSVTLTGGIELPVGETYTKSARVQFSQYLMRR